MPNVTLVLEGSDAQLVQSILRVVNTQKQMETGIRSIGSASATMEKQVVGSFNKIDASVRQSMREFDARRRQMDRRESRFVEPARFAGVDVTNLGAVQAYRSTAAQNRRFDRLNAARGADAERLAGSQTEFAQAYWAQKEQAADVANQIAYNNFDNKIAKMEKARLRRSQIVSGMVRGAAAATAAIYAAGMFYDQAAEKLNRVGDAGLQFNEEMRPLLALGGNLRDIPGQKLRVRDVSTGLGVDTASAAHGLFMLQSAAANLSPEGRQDILGGGSMLTRVAGGDFQTNLTAVTKLMQTYGKEMGNASTGANKLLMTQDQAAVTMEELSQLMPDILPAAKLMKVTYDELAGSIITATQVMGRNEKTFTGIRNLFLHLPEARDAGLIKPGSNLLQILDQLHNVDPDTLIKIFGERTVSVVAALAEKSGEVAKNFKMMHELGGNAGMEKFALRMQDGITFDAEILKSAQQQVKNADAVKFEDPWLRRRTMDLKLTEAGYEMRDDPLAEMLDFTGLGKKLNMAASMSGGEFNEDRQIALSHQVDALRRSKDPASRLQADRIRVRGAIAQELGKDLVSNQGGFLGFLASMGGEKTLVNELYGDEVQKLGEQRLSLFDQLRGQGFNLTSEEFDRYLSADKSGRLGSNLSSQIFLGKHASTAAAREQIAGFFARNAAQIRFTSTPEEARFAQSYGDKSNQYALASGFNKGLSFEDFMSWSEMASQSPGQALNSLVRGGREKLKGLSFDDLDKNGLARGAIGLLGPGGLAALPINTGFIGGSAAAAPTTTAPRGPIEQFAAGVAMFLNAANIIDTAANKFVQGKNYVPPPVSNPNTAASE